MDSNQAEMVETSEKEVQKVPFLCFIVLEIQIDISQD